MTTVRRLARLERLQFADLLDGLTGDQWAAATLCDGWTVRDVAAHTVAYLDQSRTRLAIDMVRSAGSVDRLNARALPTVAAREPADLVAAMRCGAEPSGAGALYGGRVALIECLVHQQDIRRPLGVPRTISEEALQVALRYARYSPVIGGARRTRGLRLIATDVEWSAGRGLAVRGTGEALLLAMTGRATKISDELEGEGAARWR
jgi:uncharacterized protein (TIGR03083 family)